MPPRIIGPYKVMTTLGSGGVGTVYRAIDERNNDVVALKLLSTGPALDPNAARRMAREFEALVQLNHDNVVRVFDAGVFHGYPYLAMELIEGLNLREYLSLTPRPAGARTFEPLLFDVTGEATEDSSPGLRAFGVEALLREPDSDVGQLATFDEPSIHHHRGAAALRALASQADEPPTEDSEVSAMEPSYSGPAPEAERPSPSIPLEELNDPERVGKLKDALLQICEALAYVHSNGLVHRDLKPANIMVDEDRRVKLMDFGLAKFLADDHAAVTASGRLVGTYRYMSPEQILGEPVDGRSDLYSLGIMLYELLAGRAPFAASTPQDLWRKILEQDAVPLGTVNPGVDYQLARVALRLMRKEPSERFQTAEEVFEALVE